MKWSKLFYLILKKNNLKIKSNKKEVHGFKNFYRIEVVNIKKMSNYLDKIESEKIFIL